MTERMRGARARLRRLERRMLSGVMRVVALVAERQIVKRIAKISDKASK